MMVFIYFTFNYSLVAPLDLPLSSVVRVNSLIPCIQTTLQFSRLVLKCVHGVGFVVLYYSNERFMFESWMCKSSCLNFIAFMEYWCLTDDVFGK